MLCFRNVIKLSYTTFVLLCLQKLVYGFTCYSCSYDVRRTEEWNHPECKNDTISLGRLGEIECDEDKYCFFQLMYDKGMNVITNYDRSCTATSDGNHCTEDCSNVICRTYCQGDFCNSSMNVITNYDRSCSATSNGNHCTEDWSNVICRMHCQGDYCNGDATIEGLKEFLPSSSDVIMTSYWNFILPLCVVTVFQYLTLDVD